MALEELASPREHRASIGSHRTARRIRAWTKASRSAFRGGLPLHPSSGEGRRTPRTVTTRGHRTGTLEPDLAVREGNASKGVAPEGMARQAMKHEDWWHRADFARRRKRRGCECRRDDSKVKFRKERIPAVDLSDHPWHQCAPSGGRGDCPDVQVRRIRPLTFAERRTWLRLSVSRDGDSAGLLGRIVLRRDEPQSTGPGRA
jgi:hypothetical protein